MSLGKRGPDEKQEPIWIEAARLATPAGHPFYERLNRLLSKRGFDAFAEAVGEILREATGDPEIARGAPYTTPVRRLDEAAAAKRPVIRQRID